MKFTKFSRGEIDAITPQLKYRLKRVKNSPVEILALGFVDEIEDGRGKAVMFNREGIGLELYFSQRYLEQRGIDVITHNPCALVEYTTRSGDIRLELVKNPDE